MSKGIKSVRGMRDILPEESARWQQVEQLLREVLAAYGYQELRLPILESTALFKRSIGEVTDIVEKEMYTFDDRNGESLTLRPEGTAGCVRAGIQNGLLHNQEWRLWYLGPMFRHERPQRGRYRQFHQLGVEAFGFTGPDLDAEQILMAARLWRRLGIEQVRLEINSLGSSESRAAYRELLVRYLRERWNELDEESQRRLDSNPLRVLDSKAESMAAVIEQAPQLTDHLDDDSAAHFDGLRRLLDQAGVPYQVNPRLVRGLDYYGKTVFEWITDQLGAQGTICAGGRYDGLVEQLGGRATPAAGFAIGLERLIELCPEQEPPGSAELYLAALGERAGAAAVPLAERLRDRLPGVRLLTHCGGGALKGQMKRADRSGARFALLLGDSELDEGRIGIKPLRGEGEQISVSLEEAPERVAELLGGGE